MARSGRDTEGASGRPRGRPPRIDRQQIVDAAVEIGREVGLADLSMTSVAHRLGVHRSALNYHVRDRDELVELVATAVLDYDMNEPWQPPEHAPWQEWIRAFSAELRRVLLAHSPLAVYFRFPPGAATGGLEQVDRMLGRLAAAGFDDASVSRSFVCVAQMVFMSVRDELMAAQAGTHPQDVELAQALSAGAADELPNLRRFLATGGHSDPDAQFAFNLECLIAGLETQLAERAAPARRRPRRTGR